MGLPLSPSPSSPVLVARRHPRPRPAESILAVFRPSGPLYAFVDVSNPSCEKEIIYHARGYHRNAQVCRLSSLENVFVLIVAATTSTRPRLPSSTLFYPLLTHTLTHTLSHTLTSTLFYPLLPSTSGSFHCDEALGCFLLTQTAQFRDAIVTRSRDPAVLSAQDCIVDVGGTYDPSTHRYDHHQKGFEEVFGDGFTTKLSSAGLIYKHFGREIIASRLAATQAEKQDEATVQRLYRKLYQTFIEAIDGIDNGVNQYDSDVPAKYQVHLVLFLNR